jgi:4-amino-4-deoxy-L-arabinose transferase-like glycosyltransferase
MTPILAPARHVDVRALVRPLARSAAAGLALLLILRLAVRASLPTAAVAILAPAALIAFACALFRLAQAFGAVTTDRPLRRRHGLLVIALGAGIALPLLGAFSLVDPWETHYAEVAREMIERRDFISPWWANEGWFMSKPVLTFWLEAIAMVVLGVRTGPDELLAGGARPEWAVRMPAFVLALVASYVLYWAIARTCGRRAGLFGAIALWTMPGFALLSHQALTDMPLVACTAASLGFLLRALDTPDAAQVDRYALRFGDRTLTLHAGHLLAALILLLAGPQLLGLALDQVHHARFSAGSPHACGLPSQPPCVVHSYAHPRLQPGLIALFFAPIALWLVVRLAEETRKARLFSIAAWTFAAVATMAKGPAGLVVPAGAALIAIARARSLRPLLRLEILTGLALAVALIAPWYLAVYARHGRSFLDELVLRHMLGRTLEHLHDTNAGEDVGLTYVVKQLGYATFPWCGLLAAASLSLPQSEDRSRRALARTIFFGALLVAFALVAAMRTKFHHYVLLGVPPCAAIVGLWLDERLAERSAQPRSASSGILFVGAACATLLVARDLFATPATLIRLLTYRYDRIWPDVAPLGGALLVLGVLAAIATALFARTAWRPRAALALGATALVSSLFVLDVYLVRAAPDGGQREVILAYERARETRSSDVPLVAYQLNWKGENFYTGNRLAIFISGGQPMRTWLEGQKRAHGGGAQTVYFVTEKGRVDSLRAELGTVRTFEKLTDDHDSAEFCLVAVRM